MTETETAQEVIIDLVPRTDNKVAILFTKQYLWREPRYVEIALTHAEAERLMNSLHDMLRKHYKTQPGIDLG